MGKPITQEDIPRQYGSPNREGANRRHSVLTDYYSSCDNMASLPHQHITYPQVPSDTEASRDGSSSANEEGDKSKGVAGKKITGPFHNAKYKAKMCKNWEKEGKCPYEEKCQFAHGAEEMNHWAFHRSKTQNAKNGRFNQRHPNKGKQQLPMQQMSQIPFVQPPAGYTYGGAYDHSGYGQPMHGTGQYGAHAHARASAAAGVDFNNFDSSRYRAASHEHVPQMYDAGFVSASETSEVFVPFSGQSNVFSPRIPSQSKQRRASYQHTYPAPDYNMFVQPQHPARGVLDSLNDSLPRIGGGFGSVASSTESISGRSSASSDAFLSDSQESTYASYAQPSSLVAPVASDAGLAIPSAIEESDEEYDISLAGLSLLGGDNEASEGRSRVVSPIGSPIGSAANSPTSGPVSASTRAVSPLLVLAGSEGDKQGSTEGGAQFSNATVSNNSNKSLPPPLFPGSGAHWGQGLFTTQDSSSPNVMDQLFQGDSRLIDLKEIM